MPVEDDIESIRAEFELLSKIGKSENPCRKLYCTTCGGMAGILSKNLDRKTKSLIEAVLATATRGDIDKFGFWREFITRNYGAKCREIIEKQQAEVRRRLDLDSIPDIDCYLFDARHLYNCQDSDYCSLVDRGIELALGKEDESLIETLILVLGEAANNYPSLIDLAIHKSKTNENIKRVLYNKLRHLRDDVRGYVGNGFSVDPLDW